MKDNASVVPLLSPERIAYSVSDAAKAIGRTPNFLRQEMRAGRLKFYHPAKPTAEYMVFADDLKAWLRGDAVAS